MKQNLWRWIKQAKTIIGNRIHNKNSFPYGRLESFRKGHILHRRGEQSDFIYLLLSGSCESLREKNDGYSELAATLVPGDSIGAFETGEGAFEDTTIRAASETTVLQIPRASLKQVLNRRVKAQHQNVPVEIFHLDSGIRHIQSVRRAKIICLTTLSCDLPYEGCIGKIIETVGSETAGHVLHLILNGTPDAPLLEQWESQTLREDAGISKLEFYSPNNAFNPKILESLLDHYSRNFSYILIDVGRHTALDFLLECIRQSVSTYVFLRQSPENLFEFNLLFKEAMSRRLPALKPLIFLGSMEMAHGISNYMESNLHHKVHFYLREDGERENLNANLRRLGREICDSRVGLALSSGGARGLAHIGVMQVLEENGLEVDAIAGSSMGAYIAAVWGKGYSGDEMEKFAGQVEGYHGVWRIMDLAMPPLRGFLDTKRVRARLERTIGESHFSDMVRPIRIVATRIDMLERVIFSGGNVIDAVLASMAIPGIYVPVILNGIPYVDGGVSDPLPVDALHQMGINKVIAVNTIPTPDTLRACGEGNGASTTGSWWLNCKTQMNGLWNPFADGNAFDTIMRSISAAQTRLSEVECAKANIVLRPYACGGRWHDFGNPSRYISLGREETQKHLFQIKNIFHQSEYEKMQPPKILVPAA